MGRHRHGRSALPAPGLTPPPRGEKGDVISITDHRGDPVLLLHGAPQGPYGHQLAEECPADLAEAYLTFFSGHPA